MGKPKDLKTVPAVEAVMAKDAGLSVIDFWAPWCGPCKAMGPQFAAVAEAYGDKPVGFYKIDTEAHGALAEPFHVRSLPTTVFAIDGQIVDVVVGAMSAARLTKKIETVLSKARGESFWTRMFGGKSEDGAEA